MTQAPAPFKIGELLVREGYLTLDALKKVLELQKEQGYISKSARAYKPFGQICVELKLISTEELQRFLRKHNKRILLGELLINQKILKPAQIEQALQRQQQQPGRKLGQILLEQQLLNEHQLVEALSVQLDVPRIMPSLELLDLSPSRKTLWRACAAGNCPRFGPDPDLAGLAGQSSAQSAACAGGRC